MRKEIEARLLDINEEEFIALMKKHNAEFDGDWLMSRNVYDFNPVDDNKWIRLRTTGEETTLTIKEISSSKIDGTKESEIVVSDFNETDLILNKLGYIARSKQENRRIRYMLNNVEIDIDFWPHIPTYVEFEAESEQQIIDVCKLLNVDYNKLTTIDVMSIYNHYGIDFDMLPSVLLLEDNRKK